jgi:hypothetical protein
VQLAEYLRWPWKNFDATAHCQWSRSRNDNVVMMDEVKKQIAQL